MSSDRPVATVRLDKWLWRARFFKSRRLAGAACSSGRIRVDGKVVRKAHHAVRIGDVLTLPVGRNVRVIRIEALGVRRGPSAEARTLYVGIDEPCPGDLAVPQDPAAGHAGSRQGEP